jgi:hypothetical protein
MPHSIPCPTCGIANDVTDPLGTAPLLCRQCLALVPTTGIVTAPQPEIAAIESAPSHGRAATPKGKPWSIGVVVLGVVVATSCLFGTLVGGFTLLKRSMSASPPLGIAPPPPMKFEAPVLPQEPMAIELPGEAEEMEVGGDGRYLVLWMPTERQLAIFDGNQAKIIHFIRVEEPEVFFAAGMEKLIVLLPQAGVAMRYRLDTAEREAVAPLPQWGTVKTVCMGSASAGPLLVQHTEQGWAEFSSFTFFDIEQMQSATVTWRRAAYNISTQDPVEMRASPDGRVYGLWESRLHPHCMETFVLDGHRVSVYYEDEDTQHVIPGPDGKTIFTDKGRRDEMLRPLGTDQRYSLPARHGRYYGTLQPFLVSSDGSILTLCSLDAEQPLGKVANFNVRLAKRRHYDKYLHILPELRMLVSLPGSGKQLVVQRLELESD